MSTNFKMFYGFALKLFIIFRNFSGIRINTRGCIIIKIAFMAQSEDSIEYLSPEELDTKAKSKMDLYRLSSIDLGWFLPSYRRCPTRYLSQFLSWEKKVLLETDVKTFDVPQYSELSVRKLYPYIKDSQNLNVFFPDYNNSELPERKLMISVLCTTRPNEITQLVKDSRQKRSVFENNDSTELIKVRSSIKSEIMAVVIQKVIYGSNSALNRHQNERQILC